MHFEVIESDQELQEQKEETIPLLEIKQHIEVEVQLYLNRLYWVESFEFDCRHEIHLILRLLHELFLQIRLRLIFCMYNDLFRFLIRPTLIINILDNVGSRWLFSFFNWITLCFRFNTNAKSVQIDHFSAEKLWFYQSAAFKRDLNNQLFIS